MAICSSEPPFCCHRPSYTALLSDDYTPTAAHKRDQLTIGADHPPAPPMPRQHTLLPHPTDQSCQRGAGGIRLGPRLTPPSPPPARLNNIQMHPIATKVVGHMKLSTPAMVSSRFQFRAANSGQSGPFHHGTACQSLQSCYRLQPPERLGVVTTRERP